MKQKKTQINSVGKYPSFPPGATSFFVCVCVCNNLIALPNNLQLPTHLNLYNQQKIRSITNSCIGFHFG